MSGDCDNWALIFETPRNLAIPSKDQLRVSSLENAQTILFEQLRDLSPTGDHGFEGFMAGVLSEFTSQSFHVVKSGHQEGSDVRSAPHNLVKVGLEAKRYGESTTLNRDELLAKVTQASLSHIPVDLWLLAATRAVDASDKERLQERGEACGIGILVLDWPSDRGQLCDLAVLCASAPTTCERLLASSDNLDGAIELIRGHRQFAPIRCRLQSQLKRADMGYESARVASEKWMTEAQGSLANAKSLLGGHHDLGQSSHGVIPRTAINKELCDWYQSEHGMASLVGDEGTGKSWAMLDWCNHLKSSESGAPLIVFLKATKVDPADIKGSFAKALLEQTKVGSVDFWRKRIDLWEKAGGPGVPILILLDGLNENFEFKRWSEWLQPLFEDRLQGMYRVIASCWTNWWDGSLMALSDLLPQPRQVSVGPFDDAELGDLLSAMDIQESDFASGVLELMRFPRLSSLVARHRETLQESGDLTAERVIYEDWKDRLNRRGPATGLTDAEFQETVARLGIRLREDMDRLLTRQEVLSALSAESGKGPEELREAFIEITSSTWLIPGDKPYEFKVAKERIHYVLGLTLLSEVRKETDVSAIEATIADFLDPLKSHSLGCMVLRAAATIALLEQEVVSAVRETVLSTWLNQKNFEGSDFDAFWRLAQLNPEIFLNVGETAWLGASTGFLFDEVLIKSFANAAEFQDFGEALKQRLARWLGMAWGDPLAGTVIGPDDPREAERVANSCDRYSQLSEDESSESCASVDLDESTSNGWSWLSPRALAIISYVERAPYAKALEAWALSRSVMHFPRHIEEMAWILRLNEIDPTEGDEAVENIIGRLLAQDNDIYQQAAKYLERAKSNVDQLTEPQSVLESTEEVRTDIVVQDIDAGTLTQYGRRFLLPNGWKLFTPHTCADLANETVLKLVDSTDDNTLDLVLNQLGDLLILLSDSTQDHFEQMLTAKRQTVESDSKEATRRKLKLDFAQFQVELYRSAPTRQSTLVLSSGLGAQPHEWLPYLRPVRARDIGDINTDAASLEYLAVWLGFLVERMPEEDISTLQFLPNLIAHSDPKIRLNALILAVRGTHEPALRAYAACPYSASRPEGTGGTALWEDFWRNQVLLKFCDYQPNAALVERLSPEHIALIVKNRPTDKKAVRQLNDYLREEFQTFFLKTEISLPSHWESHEDAIACLVESDLQALLSWLEPWINKPHARAELGLMAPSVMIDTMRALRVKAPESALKLYDALIAGGRDSLFSVEGILNFPLEVPDLNHSQSRRDDLLSEATDDRSLLQFSVSAFECGQQDWLFEAIRRLEASHRPADVAKGYTLLGFCDEHAQADEIWDAFLSRPPADMWLTEVTTKSFKAYSRNRQARAAFQEFWSSGDAGTTWYGLKQVIDLCDERIGLWVQDISPAWADRPYRKDVAFGVAVKRINDSVKKDKDAKRKLLFHTPIGYSIKAPWHWRKQAA